MTLSRAAQIERDRARAAKLQARADQYEAREKERARKANTRRKIMLGGAVIAALRDISDPSTVTAIALVIEKHLSRKDRKFVGPLDEIS